MKGLRVVSRKMNWESYIIGYSMALEGGEMAQSFVSVCEDLSLGPGDSSRKAECSDTHL